MASGRELCTLEGHMSDVWSVAWSPDGTQLATASEDNLVLVWGFSTLTPTATPDPAAAPSPTKTPTGGSSSNDPFSVIREIEATVAAIEGTMDVPPPSWIPTEVFGW